MQISSKVIGGVIVVAVIGFSVYWLGDNKSLSNGKDQTSAPVETTNPASASGYKDGTYNTTATYMSPGGTDNLGVAVTLKNNTISAVTVTNMAGDGTSKMYQNRFIGGIQAAIIGKSIADLKVGVVSGASLASSAFNSALTTIRTQASN